MPDREGGGGIGSLRVAGEKPKSKRIKVHRRANQVFGAQIAIRRLECYPFVQEEQAAQSNGPNGDTHRNTLPSQTLLVGEVTASGPHSMAADI
ncbi:hypothetical protein PG984_003679 [Apiospora sp. TS-2023a]